MLTWTLYELIDPPPPSGGAGRASPPSALAAVRAEAATAFATPRLGPAATPPAPSRAAAEGMAFTLACLKETLRKYSVVPIVTRVAAADTALLGIPIPRGTHVAMLTQAVHNSWPDAGRWGPERFLPGGDYETHAPEDLRAFTYLPFIQGPRNCLGQYFALLEARLVLARLVAAFDFERATRGPVVRHPKVIPTGPAGGLPVRVRARA